MIRDASQGVVDSPASALRQDFSRAVGRGMQRIHPGLPILPGMATGASDCMWYRSKGVDCYVMSALFMHSDDYLSHGLNERAPLAAIRPAIAFYRSLFSDLSK
jgi:acetylornithine deacetylase/succinyl-diaminopimelate desuccinylase-like protein